MKKLCLVDGSGFIFRAFHALPPLNTKSGVPVNAVYGFTKAIIALKERTDIDYLLIVFDSSRTTFRNAIYADYKTHRPPPPPDLLPQFDLIKQVPNALNVSSIEIAGFEADDIIATYTKKALDLAIAVEIISSDKDLMQLIDDKNSISMFDPIKKIVINEAKVLEKFGVLPNKVIDVQALMGDSSDNVPGVKGIGPKTAAELIKQFGSLENIFNNINNITKDTLKTKLINSQNIAFISKQLVTLCNNINLEKERNEASLPYKTLNDITLFTIKDYIPNNLYPFLYNLSFSSLATNIAKKHNHELKEFIGNNLIVKPYEIANNTLITEPINLSNFNSISITTITELNNYIDNFIKNRHNYRDIVIFFDNKEELSNIIIGNTATQITFDIKNELTLLNNNSISYNNLLDAITKIALCDSVKIIFFNLLSLITTLSKICSFNDILNTFLLVKNYEDLQLMLYVLKGPQEYTNLNSVVMQELLAEYGLQSNTTQTNAIIYLHQFCKQLLIKHNTYYIYADIDKPLLHIIVKMHCYGIYIDNEKLNYLSLNFSNQLKDLENAIYTLCNYNFNIASAKQLGEILFEKLNIKGNKHKTGSWKTDSATLEEILYNENTQDNHKQLIQKLLIWRKLFKLKTTYTDGLAKYINNYTNRIHSIFFCCSTTTARLSSQHPNLQNIPIKTVEGKEIRSAFISYAKGKIISLDFSQIELRLLAHIANVQNLLLAFKNNADIHTQTAAEIFNLPVNEVTPDLRRNAKAINFGIIYGQSSFGLANSLGITKSKAKEYIDNYFNKYPEIKNYMQNAIKEAETNGFVTTILHRRCFVEHINSSNYMAKANAQRAAINAKIQGSASDVVRIAMLAVNDYIVTNNINAKLLLQIHDELVIESFEEDYNSLAINLQHIIENSLNKYYTINVPLIVDYKIGNNWLN